MAGRCASLLPPPPSPQVVEEGGHHLHPSAAMGFGRGARCTVLLLRCMIALSLCRESFERAALPFKYPADKRVRWYTIYIDYFFSPLLSVIFVSVFCLSPVYCCFGFGFWWIAADVCVWCCFGHAIGVVLYSSLMQHVSFSKDFRKCTCSDSLHLGCACFGST